MSIKFLLLFLLFNYIHLQYYDNPIRFLRCGNGIEPTPDLVEYPKELSKEDKFSPIRIFIDYTRFELDITQFDDIAGYRDMIKEKLSKAAILMEQIVNVQRFTEKIIFNDNLISKIFMNIPNFDSLLRNGVSYDLIIVPKIRELQKVRMHGETKNLNFLSYPLVIEPSLKRPIIGVIEIYNIDYSIMTDNTETYFLNSFIHQLMHIMVFDTKLIKNFPNYIDNTDNPPYYIHTDYSNYRNRVFISTPKVLEFTKRHFSNPNLKGLELEGNVYMELEDNMYHWEARFMIGDIMVADFYEEQAISEMTLGLFEDSSWYNINYYTGGLFRYGKNETFIFTDLYCINNYNLGFRIKSMFCSEEYANRCTGGRLNKGYCKFFINEFIPSYFQYYDGNSTKGGRGNVDFCPITQKDDFSKSQVYNFYPGNCRNGLYYYREGLEEEFTDHSFCAISNVIPKKNGYGNFLFTRGVCYQMYCTDTTLTIQIGNFYITCPREGGVLEMPNESDYFGSIECPDYNLICTGTVVCNNIEECIEKKSRYKESTFIYEGRTYAVQNLNNYDYYHIRSKGEGTTKGKCGKNCLYCTNENSCLQCREGLYALGSIYPDGTKGLFCDLEENFSEDKFEFRDGIYYFKNENYYNAKEESNNNINITNSDSTNITPENNNNNNNNNNDNNNNIDNNNDNNKILNNNNDNEDEEENNSGHLSINIFSIILFIISLVIF